VAFDAGTIMARLDLDDAEFARKLAADVAKIEALEHTPHEVKITERVDESGLSRARMSLSRFDQQLTTDAESRMRGGRGSILGTLSAMFSGRSHLFSRQIAGGGGGGGGGGLLTGLDRLFGGATTGGGGAAANIASAAGPGLNVGALGGGAMPALIGTGAAVGLSVLPSLLGVGAAAGGGLLGVGAGALIGSQVVSNVSPMIQKYNQAQQALLMAQTPQQRMLAQQQMTGATAGARQQGPGLFSIFQSLTGFQNWWQKFTTSLAPMLAGPLRQVLRMFETLGPLIRQTFGAALTLFMPFARGLMDIAHMVLPLLNSLFRASAPALRPLLDGLGLLVRNMLPGMITLVKATAPVMGMFAKILGGLGSDLGKMFAAMAPAVRPSMIILKAIFDAVGGLLPVLGKLAAMFAVSLAPVITAFAKAFAMLEPTLMIIGRVIARLAGAVLGDLAQILIVVARLVIGIAPSLNVLASALGQVFATLETSGVFGVIASALERVAPLLANLINALVVGLAPVLPLLIRLLAQLVEAGVQVLVAALQALIPVAIILVQAVLKPLIPVLLALTPLLIILVRWIGDLLVAAIRIVTPILIFLARVISGVAAACAALDKGMISTIQMVARNWRTAWGDIKDAAVTAWQFIHDNVYAPLTHVFRDVLPGVFHDAAHAVGRAWDDIKNAVEAPVKWVVDNVVDGLISAFDWISGKVGGPHIAQVHPFGLAGGGRIPGWGGGDRWPALLEGGEVVVPKEKAGPLAWLWKMLGIPGYQLGGIIHGAGNIFHHIGSAVSGAAHWVGHELVGGGKILAALATGNKVALLNALTGMFPHGVGGAVGSMAGLLTAIPRTLASDAIHFLISQAASFFGSPFRGHYGAGVAQWRGDVLRALAMESLPLGLASRVLFQMQTESGGNPNAINLTDSNAMAGDPSRGLLQTIMSTFRAYHWPGTSFNIYDPLANIAAAINYAFHRYGPALMSGGMGMGSGHGYDGGGWWRPGTAGWNTSGQPEAVLTRQQWGLMAGGLSGDAAERLIAELHAQTEALADVLGWVPDATGAALGDVLNGVAGTAVRRSYYGAR
jgi:phage-related protein